MHKNIEGNPNLESVLGAPDAEVAAEHVLACDASRVWLPEIITRVAAYLSDNEVACGLRLADRTAAALLKGHTRVRLSQPCPPGAFAERWSRPGSCRDLTLKQRRRLLCLTAASGVVANLEVALAAAGCLPTPEVLDSAAGGGHVGLCQWLTERHGPALAVGSGTLVAAAAGGSREACEWCLAAGVWTEAAPQAAARCGHERLLDWLMGQRPRDTRFAQGPPATTPEKSTALLAAAVEGLGLPAVRRLWAQHLTGAIFRPYSQTLSAHPPQGPGPAGPAAAAGVTAGAQHGPAGAPAAVAVQVFEQPDTLTEQARRYVEGALLAAAAGSTTPDWRDKLEWLLSQHLRPLPHAFAGAVRLPPGECAARMGWLEARRFPVAERDAGFSVLLAREPALSGNTEAVQWLLTHGPRPGEDVAGFLAGRLASAGNLGALQALVAAGFRLRADQLLRPAAGSGEPALVTWLLDTYGGPGGELRPDVRHLLSACYAGRVEVMERLQGWGCPLSPLLWRSAAVSGCEAALEWLQQRGCPLPDEGHTLFQEAAPEGDTRTLEVLRRLGFGWGPDGGSALLLQSVLASAPVGVLRWMTAHGCRADLAGGSVIRSAARHGPQGSRGGLQAWLAEEEERQEREGGSQAAGELGE
ncbi:hypothetical protein HYH03_002281 [Edaphochlamys debaryana]|uniref:Ankyrin repeat domain-containing protein n=1 Tax=Edaphochlamys debaryana TaxID=47281 RepID=A0A835YLQ2_9CHLO|nr:hypothetical protein HYH03_002281 [Edaphochlamys debaryana]|eukprot:KAG2499999.1 hypothetical protein HYH03_002281 [Edaphochlamys debaryana]